MNIIHNQDLLSRRPKFALRLDARVSGEIKRLIVIKSFPSVRIRFCSNVILSLLQSTDIDCRLDSWCQSSLSSYQDGPASHSVINYVINDVIIIICYQF